MDNARSGEETGCPQESSYFSSDKIQKLCCGSNWLKAMWIFSSGSRFFFHCLAVFPAVTYLAAFHPASFCFSFLFGSLDLWSAECEACGRGKWEVIVCQHLAVIYVWILLLGRRISVKPVDALAVFVLRFWFIFKYLATIVVAGLEWNDPGDACCRWWARWPPAGLDQERSQS